MRVDLAAYDASKHIVLRWFHGKGNQEIKRTISMMAGMTHVPCIVIAFWLGEETNWHPDSLAAIKRLTDFYGYDSIENKPKGCPV